jgi:hypothetical protein
MAVKSAGPHPPYHTLKATAGNTSASGNDPAIHGVNAIRRPIATAMASRAIPYWEIVELVVGTKKRTGILCPSFATAMFS